MTGESERTRISGGLSKAVKICKEEFCDAFLCWIFSGFKLKLKLL